MASLDLVGIDVRNRQLYTFTAFGERFTVKGDVLYTEDGRSTTFTWVGTKMVFDTPLKVENNVTHVTTQKVDR